MLFTNVMLMFSLSSEQIYNCIGLEGYIDHLSGIHDT